MQSNRGRPLTTKLVIVLAALTISIAIVGARVLSPYQIGATSSGIWRLNTVTGEARMCILTGDTSNGVYCRW